MKTQHHNSLAVIAVDWTGHRLAYLAAVVAEAGERGVAVDVVVDERALDSDEWSTFVAPHLAAGIQQQGSADHQDSGHEIVIKDWSGSSRLVFEALADDYSHLIVLEADHYLDDLAWVLVKNRTVKVTTQLMREPRNPIAKSLSAKERMVSLFKSPLLVALARLSGGRCDNRLLTSPLFGPSPIAQRLIQLGGVKALVDPVLVDPLLADRSGGKAPLAGPDEVSAAVIGKLDTRKSVDALLRAWINDPRLHPIVLRLCGSAGGDPEISRLVDQAIAAGAKVEFADRFVSDEEIDNAIRSSSAVICAYTGDIPSGVAALAIEAGCPVIAFAQTRLGEAVERHGIGVAVADLSPRTLLAAVDKSSTMDRLSIAEIGRRLHQRATTSVFASDLMAQHTADC